MGNRWKGEISRTILNIFRLYNRIDVLKLPFLEEFYEKLLECPMYPELCHNRSKSQNDSLKNLTFMVIHINRITSLL